MKTIFITGISSDIGIETAKVLLKEGYKVIGTYFQNKEKLQDIIYHNNLEVFYCNLKNEDSISNLYSELNENNIKIDVIINNACYYCDNDIENKTKKEFMDVLEVNVIGTFLIVKYMSKLIKNNGVIINMASSDGVDTVNEFNYDYACSKAAIINLTKSFNIIYPNMKVYALSPNWVDTTLVRQMNSDYLKAEMIKTHQVRLITPNEIANIILEFIKSDNESGCNYVINTTKKGDIIWKKI